MTSARDLYLTRGLRLETLDLEIDGTRSVLVAAICNNMVVGTFEIFFHESRQAVVLNLFVRPDFRKLGIGKQLMEFAAELARARDCTAVVVAVHSANTAALEFYQAGGFTLLTKPTV
jgi:ribosomal protein S18 acetylase RimI-like enzyme